MPPNRLSRHRFSVGVRDADERMHLSERPVFGYRDLPDNRQHVVKEGDTLFNIAGRYFAGTERAAGFWWAIADFQPVPIHDPTIRLTPGTVVVVPSLRTLQLDILDEGRRRNAS
jgi:LysM domain